MWKQQYFTIVSSIFLFSSNNSNYSILESLCIINQFSVSISLTYIVWELFIKYASFNIVTFYNFFSVVLCWMSIPPVSWSILPLLVYNVSAIH